MQPYALPQLFTESAEHFYVFRSWIWPPNLHFFTQICHFQISFSYMRNIFVFLEAEFDHQNLYFFTQMSFFCHTCIRKILNSLRSIKTTMIKTTRKCSSKSSKISNAIQVSLSPEQSTLAGCGLWYKNAICIFHFSRLSSSRLGDKN
jgi:hypothetical protein